MESLRIVEIPDKIPLRSIIQIVKFRDLPDELDSLAALRTELIRQHPEYANAPKHVVMNAIRNGVLKEAQPIKTNRDDNQLLRGFYSNLFSLFANSGGELNFAYLALGLSHAETSSTQTALHAEHYRDTPDETYDDGISTFYATLYVKKSEANPPATTLTAGTANTVTVSDATDFVENGRIQIETEQATYNCTITGIAGSVFTVGSITGNGVEEAAAFPDDDIPDSGDACTALISEGSVFVGTAATASADSGTPINRRRIEEEKTVRDSLLFDYILSGVSVEV